MKIKFAHWQTEQIHLKKSMLKLFFDYSHNFPEQMY